MQALVAEATGAFILVTAVFAFAVASDAPKGLHGLGVGLALAMQIMVFGPLTGASVNLARTIGPDVVLALTGGTVAWSSCSCTSSVRWSAASPRHCCMEWPARPPVAEHA
ncbi:aquaporin [Lentzea sp. NPDC059081]|uniref:aquaporin n=1 Tax=Lentzea sp. NPDC059081 TaxID=3346719 RepID=UPI0036816E1E